jgi:DNA-binding Lrp family transcriptional regulator
VRPDEHPDVSAIGPNHAPWLHPDLIDAVARRFLELVRQEATGADPPDLLTVAEVAARLKMSPKWVYAHQRRLGVIKLGDGPKARLRFDPRAVAELRQADAEPDLTAAPPERPPKVKRSRRRLVSRPLPAVDPAARRA